MGAWKQGLQLVFSRQKYAGAFVLLLAILLPLYSVLTNILLLPQFSPNPNIKPLEAGLVLLVAILASLGFTLALFQVFELHAASRKSIGGSIIGAGAGGTVLAAFASACTVCQPVWLFWLGLGSATAFLADYGIYVLLASLAILVYSLNTGLSAIVQGCRAHKRSR